MGSWECKRKSDTWEKLELGGWAWDALLPPQARSCQPKQATPVGFTPWGWYGHGFLAEPRESQWLSLEEAQTEKLSEGIAWEVWGGPWPGKSEQRAAQTEPGDARPPTGLLLPTASRTRGAAPDPQPALPAPAPPSPPGPAPPVERVTSGFRDGWCWAIGLLVHGRRWLGPICLAPVCAPHMLEFLFPPSCGMTCTPRGVPPTSRGCDLGDDRKEEGQPPAHVTDPKMPHPSLRFHSEETAPLSARWLRKHV